MILLYWKEILLLLLIASLCGSVYFIKYEMNKIDVLNKTNAVLISNLNMSNGSIITLQNSIVTQNNAITQLKTDADTQANNAKIALATALAKSNSYQQQSKVILSTKGKTCADAESLINSQIGLKWNI